MKHFGTVEMITDRLKLRRLRKEDAYEVFEGLRNQEEFLYYANKEKVFLEEHLKSLENIDKKYENLDYYNKIVGLIALKVMEINDSVEFSYGIDNRYTGNGYMSEALNCIIDFALNRMDVNRIQGGCCIENKASKRVMEKCNMHHEGILKSYLKLKDGFHDLHMFSLVKDK